MALPLAAISQLSGQADGEAAAAPTGRSALTFDISREKGSLGRANRFPKLGAFNQKLSTDLAWRLFPNLTQFALL